MRSSGASFEIEELSKVDALLVATWPYFVCIMEFGLLRMMRARVHLILIRVKLADSTVQVVAFDFVTHGGRLGQHAASR